MRSCLESTAADGRLWLDSEGTSSGGSFFVFQVSDSGFRKGGIGDKQQTLVFWVWDLGFRVSGSGLGFRVQE